MKRGIAGIIAIILCLMILLGSGSISYASQNDIIQDGFEIVPRDRDYSAYYSNLRTGKLYIDSIECREINLTELDSPYCYNKIISMKKEYPEGMLWTNENYYRWNGGIYSGGYGCAGFAFILSDAAFGGLPARKIDGEITINMLRVGDILRINNDTHSVVVMEIYKNHIIIAEGNYNSSIHWGRKLTKERIESADYIITRYSDDKINSSPYSTLHITDTPTNQNGDFITSDNVSKLKELKVDIVNMGENVLDALCLVGFYDKKGKLLSLSSKNFEITDDIVSEKIYIDFNDKLLNATTMKIFIWDTLSKFTPLATAKKYNLDS